MTEIPGPETIRGLAGELPSEIEIQYKTLKSQDRLRQVWNTNFIAIIPYCFKCHEPLVWHSPPDGKVLFHCPKCKCKWIKGKDWEDNKDKIPRWQKDKA